MAILGFAAVSLTAILSACGGTEAEPSFSILLEADPSQLPLGADQEVWMKSLEFVLEQRALAFGIADVAVQREGGNRVSVILDQTVSLEDARQLLEQEALLEFRQPALDEEGRVLCQDPGGRQFSVAPSEITYAPESAGGRPAPLCLGEGGRGGEIVWEPAAGADGQDQAQDGPLVAVRAVRAVVDRTRAPLVLVNLSRDDTTLLETVSGRLVGLPLGIFLDGELLAGPTVGEPVTDGRLVIAGLSLREAEILAAQLPFEPLPLPVREVSVAKTAE